MVTHGNQQSATRCVSCDWIWVVMLESKLNSVPLFAIARRALATDVAALACAPLRGAGLVDFTGAPNERTGSLFPCLGLAAAFLANATSALDLENLGWTRVEN